MHARTRKLIGTIALLAYLACYALVMMAISARVLANAAGWQHLAFYIAAGLGWVIPALPLIGWMQRPDR